MQALGEQGGQLEARLRDATRSADRLRAQNDRLAKDMPARLQACARLGPYPCAVLLHRYGPGS